MAAHLVFPVVEPSQVGEARRAATRLAGELDFDEVSAGRVALVVTELGTNLAKHAKQGRLLLATVQSDATPSLEILSLDHGPGMADVKSCLQDGFSTAGSSGTGLGAVKRLADRFSLHSAVDRGTVIAARIAARQGSQPAEAAPASGFEVGAISIAAPGETACGDAWAFHLIEGSTGQRAAVMVADGLGHGPTAEVAALEALKVFAAHSQANPSQILERAHERLRSTRGAAVAIAELDADAGTLVFSGAGNIAGRVISGVEDRSMLSQHGTVGFQIRRLQDMPYAWPAHAIVVLHSDGLVSRWTLAEAEGLLQCDPIVIAGWLIREHLRGRDDATVVVIRRR